MQLFIDGAARGNPGEAGIGVVLLDQTGSEVLRYCHYLGHPFTNNQAEYNALLHALDLARAHGKELLVHSDSELLVKQMQGAYRVKHPDLQPLYQQAQQKLKNFTQVTFAHVRREKNQIADQLANQAIDEKLTNHEMPGVQP